MSSITGGGVGGKNAGTCVKPSSSTTLSDDQDGINNAEMRRTIGTSTRNARVYTTLVTVSLNRKLATLKFCTSSIILSQ